MGLTPRSNRHKVRRGDSLWSIAKAQYDNPLLWSEIARANQLKSPCVILVGQILTLPVVNANTKGSLLSGTLAPPPDAALMARLVAYPPFKYELDKLPLIRLETGMFSLTLKLKGNVFLQKRGTAEDFEVSLSGVELKYRTETESAFRGLMSDATIKIEPPNVLSLTCHLFSAAGVGGRGITSSVGISDPATGEMTFKCMGREFKGETGPFQFKADVGFEAKLKRRGASHGVLNETLARSMCLIVAGGILVATAVADGFSFGGSVPENALSFAAAMALLRYRVR